MWQTYSLPRWPVAMAIPRDPPWAVTWFTVGERDDAPLLPLDKLWELMAGWSECLPRVATLCNAQRVAASHAWETPPPVPEALPQNSTSVMLFQRLDVLP